MAAFAIFAGALILLVECRPVWYRPAGTDPASLEEARLQATRFVDSISDRMVRGVPFDITLSAAMANQWIATLLHDRPQLKERLPAALVQPAVGFREEGIQLGAIVEAWGFRAVASGSCSITLDGSELFHFKLDRMALGNLPVPRPFWTLFVDQEKDESKDSTSRAIHAETWEDWNARSLSAGDLLRGVQIRNFFVWPNGKRLFRVGAVRIENDALRVVIEPL